MNGVQEIVVNHKHKFHITQERLFAYDAYRSVCENSGKYFSATKSSDESEIVLTIVAFECACCGKLFYLPEIGLDYAEEDEEAYLHDEDEGDQNQTHNDWFFDWSCQLSFFELSKDTCCFKLLAPYGPINCDFCGYSAEASEDESASFRFTIHNNETELIITEQYEHDEALYTMSNESDIVELIPSFLKWEIMFDFQSGRTYFTFCNEEKIDVTDSPFPAGSSLFTMMNMCPKLKKAVMSSFMLHGFDLNFPDEDINAEKLILMTRFQGFPTSFYKAIPIDRRSRVLSIGFSEIAEQLRSYNNVPIVFERYGLPNKKRLKNVIFTNPELLFFVNEIKKLLFLNYDVIIQILTSKVVYKFLAYLHQKPELYNFLHQSNDELGSTGTWDYIKSKGVMNFAIMASDYCRVSEGRTETYTIKRWKMNLITNTNAPCIDFNISLPSECDIPDEKYDDDYSIVRLRNCEEIHTAASHLNNCLSDAWEKKDCETFFGIKKGCNYVAAIELRSDTIVSALLSGNRYISEDDAVWSIYLEWINKYGLTES